MASSLNRKRKTMLLLTPAVPVDTQSERELPGPVVRLKKNDEVPLEYRDAEGLVVWEVSAKDLKALMAQLPKLKWIQFLSAGTDLADTINVPTNIDVYSGVGLHDATVAEHTLAMILAATRSLHHLQRAKERHEWSLKYGWAPEPNPDHFTTLNDANVLIWGFGSIGSTLAPWLQSMGANVTGVATRERVENGVEVFTSDALPDLLPGTDVLVMILPSTPATKGALNADLISLLSKKAWIVNVGRGTTIDEHALIDALEADKIGGAALDVFEIEPLPKVSPLWDLENVIITPHAAGGRPRGSWDLIEYNYKTISEGKRGRNFVNRG